MASLVEEFRIDDVAVDAPLTPDYNVAPTKPVYGIVDRVAPVRAAPVPGMPDHASRRELRVMRWGLVPSWAKSPDIGSRMFNARVETVTEKPSFRLAVVRRRCVVPADGYYEWARGRSGGKQAFFISSPTGSSLAMAGIYEFWRNPALPAEAADAWIVSVAVLTGEATGDLAAIHDRVPLLVPRAHLADWLAPEPEEGAAVLPLLLPAGEAGLVAHEVSPAVGNVRNNGPELVAPLSR